MKYLNRKKQRKENGFTLIEMLVSLALFSTVMVLGASALFFAVEGSRKARETSSVMGGLSYALENMSRNLRVGHSFNCRAQNPIEYTNDCASSGDNIIAFESMTGESGNSGDQWIYRYNNSSKKIERSIDGGNNFLELTPENVIIEKMKFYVDGSTSGDDVQPRVVMIISGYFELAQGVKSRFNIQTSSTQRVIDF